LEGNAAPPGLGWPVGLDLGDLMLVFQQAEVLLL
jgi:hypothetical protein